MFAKLHVAIILISLSDGQFVSHGSYLMPSAREYVIYEYVIYEYVIYEYVIYEYVIYEDI